jgi:hypothetical protein
MQKPKSAYRKDETHREGNGNGEGKKATHGSNKSGVTGKKAVKGVRKVANTQTRVRTP